MRRYKHLSYEERTLIGHYASEGYGISGIGRLLNRSKSTILMEMKRNKNQTGYNPQTAHNLYYARRARASLLDQDINLQAYVLDRLYEGHTPEQISGRLKAYGEAEKGIRYINHESIYQWLYRPSQKKQKLYLLLPCHHGRRGRRKRVHRGKIKERISIHNRPNHVLDRKEAGHFEADLIAFKHNQQYALILHERKTRYSALIKLPSKSAAHTFQAIASFCKQLPRHLLKSITFDNGMEFADHHKLRDLFQINTYFCDVYASWQKGSIENTNGRLRRDLPRKTDIQVMSESDLEQILIGLNATPRKVLEYKSPFEALALELGKTIIFSFSGNVRLRY